MTTTKKVDIWTPIISIVGIILIIFFTLNIISNKEVKEKLKVSLKKEIQWLKEIEKNQQKIDSLKEEIEIRDSLLKQTTLHNYTLQQFKDKYEKNIDNIHTMPLDSSILFFSKEINNRR